MHNKLTIGVLLVLLPTAIFAQSAREAVVSAEKAFAIQAEQAGTRAAFLAQGAPTAFVAEAGRLASAQEVWKARPARTNARLAWYPVLADAAQSGDLGYTTGPWTQFQNDRPQTTGEYVTIWRKQPDGQLKFAVAMNIERIGVAQAPTSTVPSPRLGMAVATPSTAPTSVVLDLDQRFAAAQLLKPGLAYQQYLSSETRLYRPGLSTMHGAAAAANMKNLDNGYIFTPTTGYLSAAGDLGYVVGTLQHPASGRHPEENGSYLRVWRREAGDGWRIVLEMFNFVPDTVVTPLPITTTNAVSEVPAKRRQQ